MKAPQRKKKHLQEIALVRGLRELVAKVVVVLQGGAVEVLMKASVSVPASVSSF